MSFVRLEGVARRFGDTPAVDGITLDIHRGEIFCLLGASGCGKTTLLRMLAGFEQPTAGRILIDGTDMTNVPPYERPVNVMFQSYALFPHMTVERNVAFGLEQEKLPKTEVAARVAGMLELVRLGGLAKRRPDQLSGGQRQRVALARALVKRPKLLLLDEPLAALDRKLREHTQFELLGLQERLGVTFIVVTHDQEEAMTLATRIGVMNQGRLVQVGTPTEIYESPNSRFVADFIGSINLFEEPDAKTWLAVRPEKISIARTAVPDALAGAVREVAYKGDASVYEVELDDGRRVRISAPNAQLSGQRIARGERVWVHWDPHNAVVLTQ